MEPTKRLRPVVILLVLLAILFAATAALIEEKNSPRAKSSVELARQLVEATDNDMAQSKRKAEFEKFMKDRGPGPSKGLIDFKITGLKPEAKKDSK